MDLGINGSYLTSQNYKTQNKLKNQAISQTNFTSRKKEVKEDKSNNGKFDADEALTNFAKGLWSPVTVLIKHPIAAIGMLGGTAVACSLVPVLGPILAVGFGAMGIYQIGKSGYNIVKDYQNGDYDQAEKGFKGLGEGTINTYLTAIGLRSSAKVVKEAKLMETLKTNKLTQPQRLQASGKVMTNKEAMKEILSLFTTKEGRKALLFQFKKENITQRAKELKGVILRQKEQIKEKIVTQKEFSKTPEGIRRANMTSEEISQEVNTLAKEAFDEYNIPEELRPKIEITKENIEQGGGYSTYYHKISINEDAYREGVFDLPNVIKHEATHAREALIRETLTFTKKEQLTKEYLLNKIKSGDNNIVIRDYTILGFESMKPPKMSPEMRADFAKMAENHLFDIGKKNIKNEEFLKLVEPLVDKYPEFINQYDCRDGAIKMLGEYAKGCKLRYDIGTQNSINIPQHQIEKLGNISQEEAIASFKENLASNDGNATNQTWDAKIGLGGDFDQYQFCGEEVLAQQKGNAFEIKHLEKKLETLRKTQNFDKEQEAYLLNEIEKAKDLITYKTLGKDYYKLYMEAQRNPENKELAQKVDQMAQKINKYKDQFLVNTKIIDGKKRIVVTIEKEEFVMKQIKPGVSIFIPLNTTSTADILAS